jgi:hypothetical protein
MALTDPQKFKEVAGTEVEAPRVATGDHKSVYASSDGLNVLTVSTSETGGGRYRHLVRIDTKKLTTNPYEETKKQYVSMSTYVVVDRPEAGFTVTEALKAVEGLVGLLSASTYTVTKKAIGGEN